MKKRKIVWIRSINLDLHLHIGSRIEMLKYLSKLDYDIYVVGSLNEVTRKRYFKKFYGSQKYMHFILIPMKFLNIITQIFFSIIVSTIMPFIILLKKIDIIVLDPGMATITILLNPIFYFLKPKFILNIRTTPIIERSRSRFLSSLDKFLFETSILIAKKTYCRITIVSENMKSQICKRFSINKRYIDVWSTGVTIQLFNPKRFDRIKMKKKFDLDNKFVIIHHGSFGFQRGIIETIESISLLKGKYKNCVLFLLGKGTDSFHARAKKLIFNLGIENRVIIHKAVEYMYVPKYISMCDIGIVPLPKLSIWKYQRPIKLLEYLSMEKFVIVTDIPANTEILKDSKAGISISSITPSEIAAAIKYAYDNRKNLRKWGLEGRKIIEDNYSWERIAHHVNTILTKC